jgi:hypothetical protein
VNLALGGLYSSGGGKVYGSGPTNAAVTNFAERFYKVGSQVTRRCNEAAPSQGALAYRRSLVVRGYSERAETDAFFEILRSGVADDTAPTQRRPTKSVRWKLSLSASGWLLAVLGSKALACSGAEVAMRELDPADAAFLHDLRREYVDAGATDGPMKRLLQVAQGEISWEEYSGDSMVPAQMIGNGMRRIINAADVVMTTPAGAQRQWYKDAWSSAKVIAVDEGGCMGLADLCSIWGNTLRPLVMAGDVKQLPPAVMELQNSDVNGNYANRFGLAGRVSGLAWLQGLGIPTFRLLQQMRMANDMFGLAQKLFYNDHQLGYGPGSDPSLDSHAVGHSFEKFLSEGKFKGYQAPPPGKLLPMFLHMPNTKVDQVGTSKLNRMQVKGALDLIKDFVVKTGTSANRFVVITAHRPNVDYGNRLLRSKSYKELAEMPEVQTVDSIQGCENDISVFICGTSSRAKSVGFVSNQNRLNVSITRQNSALLIIGDKTVTGKLKGTQSEMENLMKQAKSGTPIWNNSGEMTFTKSAPMRQLLVELHDAGRIIDMVSQEEADKEAAAEEEEKELIHKEKVDRITAYLETDWKFGWSWADLDEEDLEEF